MLFCYYYNNALLLIYKAWGTTASEDYYNSKFKPESNPVDLNTTYTEVLWAAHTAEYRLHKTLNAFRENSLGLQLITQGFFFLQWICFKTTFCLCYILFIILIVKPGAHIPLFFFFG